jgi:heme a synthase
MRPANTITSPILDPAPAKLLALGLGVAVALWLLWFALHIPGLELSPGVRGPAMLASWVLLATVGARMVRPGIIGAAVAGFITAALGLMALGALLTEQPDPSRFAEGVAPLRPAAGLIVTGFLLAGAGIGALGALLAGRVHADPPIPAPGEDPWLSRLAIVVAVSYIPLIKTGGIVTSTESGMAVTGWPDTFGANMFLYPISLMSQPRVFLEHFHRLFGTLAGLSTILLWLVVMLGPSTRRKFGVWVSILLGAVIIQGILGGKRVTLNNPYLGALHGAFGQVVLAYAGVLALWLSPRYRRLPDLSGLRTRPARVLATGALHASLVQLVLGSLFRHLRREGNPGAWHVILTHIALAFLVVVLAILASGVLLRFAREHRDRLIGVAGRIRAVAAAMLVVVGLQFALGWVALMGVMLSEDRGPVPTADRLLDATPVPLFEVVSTTVHQFNGAVYLLLAMLAWGWARGLHRAANPATP